MFYIYFWVRKTKGYLHSHYFDKALLYGRYDESFDCFLNFEMKIICIECVT